MCLIAHRPVAAKRKRGANIPNAVIDLALKRHPDGFGVAWREDESLKWQKFGPSEVDTFRAVLKRLDARRDVEYVTHFRFATQGPACRDLSHPFSYEDPIAGTVLVFHNGIIDVPATPQESDTQVFVRDYLAKLPPLWWRDEGIRQLVDHAVGWSRLILMTIEETVNLHEEAGETDGGLWYSSSHKAYVNKFVWPNTSGKGDTSPKLLGSWATGGSGRDDTPSDDYLDRIVAARYNGDIGAKLAVDEDLPLKSEWHEVDGMFQRGTPQTAWTHAGHALQIFVDIDLQVDDYYESQVMCDQCYTIGDAYVIDGKAYIELGHEYPEGELVSA